MPLSTTELLLIAAVLLVLFGSTVIPRFARSLHEALDEPAAPSQAAAAAQD